MLLAVGAVLWVGCSSADDGGSSTVAPTEVPATVGSTTTIATPASEPATSPTTTAPSAVTTTTTVDPEPTASSIAAEIVAAERGIRDTSLSLDAVAAFGRREQQAYQLLGRHPDLQAPVTALIPADVTTAFAFNMAARQAVVDHAAATAAAAASTSSTTPSPPSPTLPAWTIIEPRPIDELLADYHQAEAATGVPWQYLAAMNLVETRMGRISGDSSAGAQGPMQFLPATWAKCCTGNIDDPHDAILGAAVYLVSQGAPHDMHAALYGYNPNEGYVGSVTAYAANMMADPLAYSGYHAWEVYVGSAAGTGAPARRLLGGHTDRCCGVRPGPSGRRVLKRAQVSRWRRMLTWSPRSRPSALRTATLIGTRYSSPRGNSDVRKSVRPMRACTGMTPQP
ncbi:MAG: lytic transglycosylase [Ilumatobacteraceae bacterium]|nr:lytic transglycosylase [Ilumatobacteraceae bacterium]